jgi:hypothetical protein
LKDKIQIPNSETAVSVYAPALMPHRLHIVNASLSLASWRCLPSYKYAIAKRAWSRQSS